MRGLRSKKKFEERGHACIGVCVDGANNDTRPGSNQHIARAHITVKLHMDVRLAVFLVGQAMDGRDNIPIAFNGIFHNIKREILEILRTADRESGRNDILLSF